MSRVFRQTNVENLEQAFTVAEKDLGVTRLLDPEGKTPSTPWFTAVMDNTVTALLLKFRIREQVSS